MGLEIVSQALDRCSITPFGDEQHGATLGVCSQGDIVVAPGPGGLVNGQPRDLGEVGIAQRQVDVALADRRHPMPALAGQARHGRKRHFPRQHQHQRLKEQCDAGQLPGPVRFHLTHRTTGQLHARDADLQVALVLEEVQLPVALAHRVMHWMDTGLAGHGEPAAGGKIDANGQRLHRWIQVNGHHMPWLGNAQGGLEKLLVHHGPIGYQ